MHFKYVLKKMFSILYCLYIHVFHHIHIIEDKNDSESLGAWPWKIIVFLHFLPHTNGVELSFRAHKNINTSRVPPRHVLPLPCIRYLNIVIQRQEVSKLVFFSRNFSRNLSFILSAWKGLDIYLLWWDMEVKIRFHLIIRS